MIGKLFNTLSYRLSRECRKWRKDNEIYRENTWPWYQRLLNKAVKHPVRVPLELFSVILLLSIMIWGYQSFVALLSNTANIVSTSNKEDFFALWTVQSTIGAMIYPIVIGFVSLLLQRRHSAKTRLTIYLDDSAAILSGLSTLFLVAAMGIQFLFLSNVNGPTLTCWLILDGIWFIVNILGVIWFLIRTFDYLQPYHRAAIIRSYAINHVWPSEIYRGLQYNLFYGAIHYGWIPGPIYGDKSNTAKTEFLLGDIGRSMGVLQVKAPNKSKMEVIDIKFSLLSLAMRSWQRREEIIAHTSEEQTDYFDGLRRSRLFILPTIPGSIYKADTGLCRTEGSSGLRWWEKWLVRRSFKFSSSTRNSHSLSVSDILNDLISDVQIAIIAGEEVTFREAVRELVDFHTDLIKTGDFINSDELRDNYANLVDRDHPFEARMHDLWSREYHRLLESSVSKLTTSDTSFQYMANLAGDLISGLESIRPIGIQSNLLNLSRILHYYLNRWWSKTIEEQGVLDHSHCEPCLLNNPGFSIYESAIKVFIGEWESLKNYYFHPRKSTPTSWEGYKDITVLYTTHLDDTVFMMFDCLLLGNKDGAEWICDALVKWWNTIEFRSDNMYYYLENEHNLTLELLRKPLDDAKEVLDLPIAGDKERIESKALWCGCMHNYWIDICCVATYALIQLGKDCTCDKALPAQLAAHLGTNKGLRSGGSVLGERWLIKTTDDLLIAITRQFYIDGRYRARLNKFVEDISRQGKPSMVPGRIYSGSGYAFGGLSDGQLIFLCLLVKKDWSPSASLFKTFEKWMSVDDQSVRTFIEQLKQRQLRLSESDFLEYENIYTCLQKEFSTVVDFQDAIKALDLGLARIIEKIDIFRTERLNDAVLSQARLKEIIRWCSQSGFKKASADIPVSFFQEIQYSSAQYSKQSLIFQNMNKGEFVEPPMSSSAGNADQWFDHSMSRHVASAVMSKMITQLHPQIIDVDNPVTYWQQMNNAANEIRENKMSPILLISARNEPKWLSQWLSSTYDNRVEVPEGLRVTRDQNNQTDGYALNLNDIPVYVAPIVFGSSYLIPLETMQALTFTKYEDNIFVKISPEPVAGQSSLIDLKLSWSFDLNVKMLECWQLRYMQITKP